MFAIDTILRHVLVLWTSVFVAVASVPRCDAIADMIELFRAHQVEELACHSSADQLSPAPVATRYDFPTPCPCMTLDFADFFQSSKLHPKFELIAVLGELDVTDFVSRFWQLHVPHVDEPPPRLA